ncbi:MAG: outer membrane lipoprotein carrier protein LolA [Anaeroplasma sp.]
MKKALLFLIAVFMFILGGCNAAKDVDDFSAVDKLFSELTSYSLTGEMTIFKSSNEVKSTIAVDYLKPSYYKVSFKSAGGNEQIIIKNTDGVFVLTPSLSKQFRFDSDWPINSSHAYLIDVLWNDIKNDNDMKYEITDNQMIISASLNSTNQKFNKLKLYYNLKDNIPTKVEIYNNKDELKIEVKVKSFNYNSKLDSSIFNQELVMDDKSNQEGASSDSSAAITVGYVCEDTVLKSKKETNECTILCYGGAKTYTIVAKKLEIVQDSTYSYYSDYDILEGGLLMYSSTVSRYYFGDIEISIYSNSLDIDEVALIISQIAIA